MDPEDTAVADTLDEESTEPSSSGASGELSDAELIAKFGGDTPEPGEKGETKGEAGTGSKALDSKTIDDRLAAEDTPEKPGAPADDTDILKGYGLDKKYRTLDDALKGFSEAQKFLGQRDEFAEFGRQVAPHWQQYNAWLASQAQMKQPEGPPPAWNPPEPWNENLAQLEALAQANGEAWQNLPEAERERLAKYVEHRQGWWKGIFNNPEKLYDVFGQKVEAAIGAKFKARDLEENAKQYVGNLGDLVKDPEAVRELDYLLSLGTQAEIAREHVLMRRALAQRQQQPKGNGTVDKKREQMRARVANRGSGPAEGNWKPDITGMTKDEVLQAALERYNAGDLR